MCALLRGAAFPGAVQAGCAKAACECLIVTVWYGHGGSSNLLQLGCEQCAGTQFQVARNVFFARREDNEIVVADSLPVYGLLITYPTQANILWRLYETLLGRGVQCQLPKMYVSRLWKFTFLLETWTAAEAPGALGLRCTHADELSNEPDAGIAFNFTGSCSCSGGR